jgi:hypothetical protein
MESLQIDQSRAGGSFNCDRPYRYSGAWVGGLRKIESQPPRGLRGSIARSVRGQPVV